MISIIKNYNFLLSFTRDKLFSNERRDERMARLTVEKENVVLTENCTKRWVRLVPGILICVIVMIAGSFIAWVIGLAINLIQGFPLDRVSPISGIFVAVFLGLIVRNLLGVHEAFIEGVSFSIRTILKLGVILLGIRLSFMDVLILGAWGIPIILMCVGSGLIVTFWITNKMNQSQRLGTLIASGTGICGVTAIAAISPGIKANEEEVAYAIANITVFGLVAMFLYPFLAFTIFENDPLRAGLFLGTSIHDTAQVVGASMIYSQSYAMNQVVDIAITTKLTRNVLIILVVPLLSYYFLKKVKNEGSNVFEDQQKKWFQHIPLFVVGFLGLALVRSVGDFGVKEYGVAYGVLSSNTWSFIYTNISTIGSSYLLGISMAAIGLSTNLSVFKKLGFKPFVIGMVAALSIGAVSLIMVHLLGGFIQL